mgnify:CR=1 FL=1
MQVNDLVERFITVDLAARPVEDLYAILKDESVERVIFAAKDTEFGKPLVVSPLTIALMTGMSVSDTKRLKELETENGRLKRLLADALRENEVTKEALRKKW